MVHFRQVYRIMEERNVQLPHENQKDPYIKQLSSHVQGSTEQRFLLRLIMASLVEYRGAERFNLVSQVLEDQELKEFYTMLYKSEAKHGDIFIEMALKHYPTDEVYKALDKLLTIEAEIVKSLPYRYALH